MNQKSNKEIVSKFLLKKGFTQHSGKSTDKKSVYWKKNKFIAVTEKNVCIYTIENQKAENMLNIPANLFLTIVGVWGIKL